MSYDLMVFDPASAPTERGAFLAWYQAQTEWAEDHDYNDPQVTTDALHAWFFDMIKTFPAMNGPYASHGDLRAAVTDYCIGRSVIYVAFVGSQAEPAYEATFENARKHGLGLYDVSSSEGAVWLPKAGDLACIHKDD
jgi:hypothetical protein